MISFIVFTQAGVAERKVAVVQRRLQDALQVLEAAGVVGQREGDPAVAPAPATGPGLPAGESQLPDPAKVLTAAGGTGLPAGEPEGPARSDDMAPME